ncbi:hypothetical protein NOVO_00465 [Rickettsiales bacterium Ac37b]|nr:hypothetical protein NOVO_00465 [Rickettsiales bacterium Ac37b]
MPNQYRGEINIELAGKTYNLRPTFQALCEIENEIGKSLILLLSKLDEQGILIQEQIAIIKIGIKHAENNNLPENLEELIKQKDIASLFKIICKFLEAGLCI